MKVWVSLGLMLLLVSAFAVTPALAQGPGPTPPPNNPAVDTLGKLIVIGRTVADMFQGKPVDPARLLLEQARNQSNRLSGADSGLFFFDFGDPNLPLNRFAGEVALNLLALSPLYVLAYLGILVWNIWKERPIPNPILYAVLVIGVMVFLAAFAVITQGLTQVGSFIAGALAGQGGAVTRAGLFDMVIGTLEGLNRSAGLLALPALFVAMVELIIILIQLLYRGISMAIWRLVGVILIPLSVLIEGVRARTAGRILGGFFEAWLDIVGKVSLLLVVLAISGSAAYSNLAHFILPAGLLIVIFSWKFIGLGYNLFADAVARQWKQLAPATEAAPAPLSPSGERARGTRVDEDRRGLLEE